MTMLARLALALAFAWLLPPVAGWTQDAAAVAERGDAASEADDVGASPTEEEAAGEADVTPRGGDPNKYRNPRAQAGSHRKPPQETAPATDPAQDPPARPPPKRPAAGVPDAPEREAVDLDAPPRPARPAPLRRPGDAEEPETIDLDAPPTRPAPLRRPADTEEPETVDLDAPPPRPTRPAPLRPPRSDDAVDASADSDASGAPAAAPGARARRIRPLQYSATPPDVGSEITLPDGERYRVARYLNRGANGAAFLVSELGLDGAPVRRRPDVLKQPLAVDDSYDQVNAERARRGLRTRTKQEAVEDLAAHEAEMWNDAAAGGNPFVSPALLVGKNRIKVPFAGADLGDVVRDIGTDPNTPVETKLAMLELVTRKTLEATRSLGERGVVHRDLKSDAFMIDSDGSLKIIDFGNAKRAGQSDLQLLLDKGVGYSGFGASSRKGDWQGMARSQNPDAESSSHLDDVRGVGDMLRRMALDVLPPELRPRRNFVRFTDGPPDPKKYKAGAATPQYQKDMKEYDTFVKAKSADKRQAQVERFLARILTPDPNAAPSADEALRALRRTKLASPKDRDAAEARMRGTAATRIDGVLGQAGATDLTQSASQ